jgi:hypothetical protein
MNKKNTFKMICLSGMIVLGNHLPLTVYGDNEIYRCTDVNGNVLFTDQSVHCGRERRGKTAKNKKSATANMDFGLVKIYKFIDEDGITHLSDRPSDSRYRLVYQGSGTLQPFSGGTYSAIAAIHRRYKDYQTTIQSVALRYFLEPELLHAVIQAESAYNPNARSPKGAVGLMQLMPATAERYGVFDRTDPESNIEGGSRYLRDLLDMFNGDKSLALAGYNAGENAVKRYGYQIPPYRETQNYVKIVMGLYQQHKQSQDNL